MSFNQYLQAVQKTFEVKYPQFWWEDYFLDDEKHAVNKILQKELESLTPPSLALNTLLTSLGRM